MQPPEMIVYHLCGRISEYPKVLAQVKHSDLNIRVYTLSHLHLPYIWQLKLEMPTKFHFHFWVKLHVQLVQLSRRARCGHKPMESEAS